MLELMLVYGYIIVRINFRFKFVFKIRPSFGVRYGVILKFNLR